MQRLEVSGAVRPIYGSLGVKRLIGTKERIETIGDTGCENGWVRECLRENRSPFTKGEIAR